jgi:hypothetical protein
MDGGGKIGLYERTVPRAIAPATGFDSWSKSGAEALAARIEAKWHAVGCPSVKVFVVYERAAFCGVGMMLPVIRSNLLNGLPRPGAASPACAPARTSAAGITGAKKR